MRKGRLKFINSFLLTSFLVGSGVLTSGASGSVAPTQRETLLRFTYTEYHMGIDARMVVYAPDRARAERACTAAFKRIAELDSIMSDYRPTSELMQLCAKSGGSAVPVSADLFKVLRRAEEISRKSNGAFDVTAGPLIGLWRKARKTGHLPEQAEIDLARRLVGYQMVKLSDADRSVKLAVSGMKLDLGGIAKGYAGDQAQRVLKRHGIQRALVELGGDIVVSGPPPGTKGWTIRVPNAGDDQGPADLLFANQAISSSGDTEQFVVIGGVQYSHVVDPRTGKALTQRVQSTVIAKDGLTTDPLSTVLTVLDEAGRTRLTRAYPKVRTYLRVLNPS